MQTTAENVIQKCGGPKVVAEWLALDISNVYRFTYPRSRGGTDGLIPAPHQATLLAKARERGIDLKPDDFFPESPSTPPPDGDPDRAPEPGHAA